MALCGGVGGDAWGEWLLDRLRSEGVDLTWFAGVEGVATPLAFVTVNDAGEPDFIVYGETIPETMGAIEPQLAAAVAGCDALFFGSNTLVGEAERHLTLSALDLARKAGKPFLFDPNLRLGRWAERRDAIEFVRGACEGALLVKVNREEATQLTRKTIRQKPPSRSARSAPTRRS